MKTLIVTALFIVLFSIPVKADSGDSVYTITRAQLMTSLLDTRAAIDAFTSELQGYQGKLLNERGIQSVTTKQDDLNARVRAYLVLYDFIPDMPDEFRREYNMANNICGQNGGRVKDLIAGASGNGSQNLSWLINLIKPILLAQFPYFETVINLLMK